MNHYKARAYNPNIGAFLQTDPILYAGGMNLYAYVGGDPVNWVDPLGLQSFPPGTEPVVDDPGIDVTVSCWPNCGDPFDLFRGDDGVVDWWNRELDERMEMFELAARTDDEIVVTGHPPPRQCPVSQVEFSIGAQLGLGIQLGPPGAQVGVDGELDAGTARIRIDFLDPSISYVITQGYVLEGNRSIGPWMRSSGGSYGREYVVDRNLQGAPPNQSPNFVYMPNGTFQGVDVGAAALIGANVRSGWFEGPCP